jgi:hypothetical protein
MLGVIGRQEKKGLEKLKYGETDGQALPDTK